VSRFEGFGQKALPFLKALAFHQSKDWFAENKTLYESDIRRPMGALLAAASERFATEGIPLKGSLPGSMFRVNRDVRFSKAKSPYNEHASAVLTRSGGKKEAGGAYIHIKPGQCFVGAGIWMMEPPVLNALRRKILAFPDTFLQLEDALNAQGLPLVPEDELKRLPPAYAYVESPRLQRLMRQKHFFANLAVADEDVATPRVLDALVEVTRAATPLMEFCWPVLDETPVQTAG
jgi:uncharacterized protein (TIGR02453 family)